ncbi:hypothetical protein QTP88_029197 [Uroleucon formosanum]
MAYDPDIAYRTDICVALGSMTYKCQWCSALKWKDETLGMCCSAGKVQLERLKQLPESLYSLVNALHPDHVQFMNNIRKYNACFHMTSFGGKQVTADGFLPTFKVRGQVYHLIGSILPEPGQAAQYLQIYFVCEDEREDMLHQVNPYIKDLKSAIDKIPPSESFKVVIHIKNHQKNIEADEYAKIETERLNYIKNNQAKLRADIYIHLKDAIGRRGIEANQLGQMVILPSTFTGGPRYMHERTQDAMTYVRHYGRPDLFITFTYNHRWDEIKELLLHGQRSYDRHDIIARVFRLKVKKTMNLLTKENEKDEIKTYESGRYISSSEAVWRILEFPIHERFPTVIHFAVHLENGQRVYFNEQNLNDRVNSPLTTTLLSFFDLCKVDDFAKNLLYPEVPAYYVWDKKKF